MTSYIINPPQLVAGFVMVITFVQIVISNTMQEFLVRIFLFIIITFFFYLVFKATKEINKQKERFRVLAEELERTNRKLVELDGAKNEFISIAAHQLRTPPTVIKGYITMALEEVDENKSVKSIKEYLRRALNSNERLIELIEDILDISRIESGKIQYHFEDNQNCENILDDLYKAFEVKAKKKGLKMILKRSSKPLPKIKMDSKRIREVISNLIDNAIKYTQKGKVIIEQKLSDDGEKVRTEISDTGVGIAKKDMPNLFKKFSRGMDTARLGSDGTGLGIYVGRKIVRAHHGKIWAESEGVNRGSKFIVELLIKWSEEEN